MWFIILFSSLFFVSCASEKKQELVLHQIYFPCSCSALQAKQQAAIRILDLGLEEYSNQNKILLDEEVENEIFRLPTVYLQNFTLQEVKPEVSKPETKPEKFFEAKGKLHPEKLEVLLKEKKSEDISGLKVYSNRGTGSRGLALIQDYSKRKQSERKEDKDKYYKDRIDMLEKIKSKP
jgi:hypothetical protein